MKADQLSDLYNFATGMERVCFHTFLDENIAHIIIYHRIPIIWEMRFLREIYEELQKELPTIKKKVIAKAIRELRQECRLLERIKLEMAYYRLQLLLKDDIRLKVAPIDRKMKNDFKNYVKDAFRHNKVEWHWWNNLDWGL